MALAAMQSVFKITFSRCHFTIVFHSIVSLSLRGTWSNHFAAAEDISNSPCTKPTHGSLCHAWILANQSLEFAWRYYEIQYPSQQKDLVISHFTVTNKYTKYTLKKKLLRILDCSSQCLTSQLYLNAVNTYIG